MNSVQKLAVVFILLCGARPVRAADGLNEVGHLRAHDGFPMDRFGKSCSISGETIAIGAMTSAGGKNTGSVYVFTRSDGRWSERQKPTAPDASPSDFFGLSVSLFENTLAIGARGDDDQGTDSGSVYIFESQRGDWRLLQKLQASDGVGLARFGNSISLTRNRLAIGAPAAFSNGAKTGAVYLFEKSNGIWAEVEKLAASDGSSGDQFGCSAALQGDVLVIGANLDDDFGGESGSAYVFEKSGKEWIEKAKLLANDGRESDQFGTSVAIFGDSALVGSPRNHAGNAQSGAVYAFENTQGAWEARDKLIDVRGAGGDGFGQNIALWGDTAVIAAPRNNWRRDKAGAAFVFQRIDGNWTQEAKLKASNGEVYDQFGFTVGVSETAIIATAPAGDDRGVGSGCAYVFMPTPECNGNERINKAVCRNVKESVRLRVHLVGGKAGDKFDLSLLDGTSIPGTLDTRGKGKLRFRALQQGYGVVTAHWGCGIVRSREYACE